MLTHFPGSTQFKLWDSISFQILRGHGRQFFKINPKKRNEFK